MFTAHDPLGGYEMGTVTAHSTDKKKLTLALTGDIGSAFGEMLAARLADNSTTKGREFVREFYK